MGSYRMCMCFTRKFRVTEAEPPPDVNEAFRKYAADGGNQLSADQLRRFLVEVQGVAGATTADSERIIEQVLHRRHHLAMFGRKHLTLDDFHHYLFSADLNPATASEVHHEMTAPLPHYFIYTGHNSYLTGNQLSSDCSVVPIIRALKSGVRVIELDLWPNSTKDDVHVLHGRTLTTPVELIKCLKSIKEHAFSASPYPVVITLEDHLNPALQAKVAEGESHQSEHDDEDDSDNDGDDSDCKAQRVDLSSYKHLIAIPGVSRKGGIKAALKDDPDKIRRLSLSEQALEKAAEVHGMDLVRFTQRNFLRIYPKCTRFDSSNYKPIVGWIHGAQMIAFNMQGYGKSLWLMHGMFRSNGGCGFVKKPDFLLRKEPDSEIFDPKAKLSVKKTLKVRVYMGDGWHMDFKQTHFDLYTPPDFYAKVGIAGVPADEGMKKTEKKEDDWTPVWDEEFEFPLTVPELALLRVEVHEHDMFEKDDFGGQTCLPVPELRSGIRAVPLFNRKGEKYSSVRLLMRFEFV